MVTETMNEPLIESFRGKRYKDLTPQEKWQKF